MANNIWEGERVRLRGMEADDCEIHYAWDKNTDDARYAYNIPFPNSRTRARKWAENEAISGANGDNVRLQIETLDDEHVGNINSTNTDPHMGTFSYGLIIREEHRRKGYASEAIRLLLRYFFEELRYQKCTTQVYSFNTGSIKLHKSLGFTEEGCLRRMIYTAGEFHDSLWFGINREEFIARYGKPSL